MTQRFDLSDDEQREEGIAAAALAVQRGQLVAFPTDTVYGVGADAFSHAAVELAARGEGPRAGDAPARARLGGHHPGRARGRRPGLRPRAGRAAVARPADPGPARQQPSLQWDLGDTRGTVAVRMPDHEVALELLARTGPLAVSSANRSGMPAGTDADAVEEMLGERSRCCSTAVPRTATCRRPSWTSPARSGRLLRAGAVSLEELNEIVAAVDAEIVDEG